MSSRTTISWSWNVTRSPAERAEARGRSGDQRVRQFLGDVSRKELTVGKRQRVDLRFHRRADGRMPVAEAGDRRSAGGIDIAFSFPVDDMHAFTRDGYRVGVMDLPVEHVRR